MVRWMCSLSFAVVLISNLFGLSSTPNEAKAHYDEGFVSYAAPIENQPNKTQEQQEEATVVTIMPVVPEVTSTEFIAVPSDTVFVEVCDENGCTRVEERRLLRSAGPVRAVATTTRTVLERSTNAVKSTVRATGRPVRTLIGKLFGGGCCRRR